jgi:LuxR family glucitol operon transcriptional activator
VLHPLVRAFAAAQLVEQAEFEKAARGRWVGWYIELTSNVGECWSDPHTLRSLDPEQETIHLVIQWCFRHKFYSDTIQLVNSAYYYYYVRGLWGKQPSIYLIAADSSRSTNDALQEIRHISWHIEGLYLQGSISDILPWLKRLSELEFCFSEQSENLVKGIFLIHQHSIALYRMICHDFNTAKEKWQNIQNIAEREIERNAIVGDEATSARFAYVWCWTRYWIATCMQQQGLLENAQQVAREAIQSSINCGYPEGVFAGHSRLASIFLQQSKLDDAEESLIVSNAQAQIYQGRRFIAINQHLYAYLHTTRGNLTAARVALTEAIDLFERLGMRRELAEAREELARLEAQMAEAAE